MSKKAALWLYYPLTLFINVIFLFIFPTSVNAQFACNFIYTPSKPADLNPNLGNLQVEIKSSSIKDSSQSGNGGYRLYIYKPDNVNPNLVLTPNNNTVSFKNGTTVDNSGNEAPVTIDKSIVDNSWQIGKYKLELYDGIAGNGTLLCSNAPGFDIIDAPAQSSCIAFITPTNISPQTPVTLNLNSVKPGDYDLCVNTIEKPVTITGTPSTTFPGLVNTTIPLGAQNEGTYYVYLKESGSKCLTTVQSQCPATGYTVKADGSGKPIPPPDLSGKLLNACLSDPSKCVSGKGTTCDQTGNRGPGVKTAIGCIHTDTPQLIQDLFTFISGITGSIAFLMMLYGGFKMIISQGNPQELNNAKQLFTSAIIGLLFIVFAVLLLQIIGLDVLKLPGFGR